MKRTTLCCGEIGGHNNRSVPTRDELTVINKLWFGSRQTCRRWRRAVANKGQSQKTRGGSDAGQAGAANESSVSTVKLRSTYNIRHVMVQQRLIPRASRTLRLLYKSL